MRRKRVILYVITDLHTGGAETMLCSLLFVLDRQDWDPAVLCLSDGGRPEEQLKKAQIPVYSMGLRPGKLPDPKSLVRIVRLARRIRPDLIQGWMYHGNLAAQFIRMFLGRSVPVCWGIHHSPGVLQREKKFTAGIIRLGALFSRLPEKIIYVSATSRQQHVSLGYKDTRACVIHNGVDPQSFCPSDLAKKSVRDELEIPHSAILIGFLARYHPLKDHAGFIRAAGILSASYLSRFPQNPRVYFLLAGTGVDHRNTELDRLIGEAGIREQVFLLGNRADVNRLMASLDLLSLVSVSEAFPLVILEAMSSGTPCIATNSGDVSEIIGNTGRIVEVGNPGALAEAWETFITSDPLERMELGKAARERIVNNYSLSGTARAYEELYHSIVRNKA